MQAQVGANMAQAAAQDAEEAARQAGEAARTAPSVDSFGDAVNLVVDKLQDWLTRAVELLPNFLVALLIVVAFAFLARLVRKLMKKLLRRVTDSKAAVSMLASLTSIAVIAVGVFFALGILQLDKTVTSLLAGAGVIGLALAFAFQDLASNLVAGFYLSFKRPMRTGDLVETNDVLGTVQEVDLRSTKLRTGDGQIVHIPNKDIFENKFTNYTESRSRRVNVAVGVDYGSDLPKVEAVTREAVESLEMRDTSRDVDVFFTEFGGSSINLVARFWIGDTSQGSYAEALSAAMVAIQQAYAQSDIGIPFPTRTLGFDPDALETLRGLGGAEPGSAGGEES